MQALQMVFDGGAQGGLDAVTQIGIVAMTDQ